MHVLLVEDDQRLARVLRRLLEDDRHVVEVANDGETGVELATSPAGIEVIILDIGLPDISGLEVARRVRRSGSEVAILMLTARDTVNDRVTGLDAGADDYLVKPFAMRELVARVRAAARRGVRAPEERRLERLELEELVIDPANFDAYVDGRRAGLTPTEFKLLHALALEQGRVVTRDELMQRIWGRRQRYRDRTVDVFVRKLRDKIDRQAPRHDFIHTRHGVGYKLEALEKAPAPAQRR
jgi:DNA-binding response OmpR family regulator